ncbi:hypothetical protein SAMN02745166_02096, partial [Prosthecobacter debontii]
MKHSSPSHCRPDVLGANPSCSLFQCAAQLSGYARWIEGTP